MAICIDEELCKQIKSFSNKTWPQKHVIYMRPLHGLLATYWPRFLVYITDI